MVEFSFCGSRKRVMELGLFIDGLIIRVAVWFVGNRGIVFICWTIGIVDGWFILGWAFENAKLAFICCCCCCCWFVRLINWSKYINLFIRNRWAFDFTLNMLIKFINILHISLLKRKRRWFHVEMNHRRFYFDSIGFVVCFSFDFGRQATVRPSCGSREKNKQTTIEILENKFENENTISAAQLVVQLV